MYAFDESVLDVQAVTSFVVILHTTMELWNDLPISRLVARGRGGGGGGLGGSMEEPPKVEVAI